MSIEIHNLTGEPLLVYRVGAADRPTELQHEEKLVMDGYDPSAAALVIRPARDSGTIRDWRPKLRDDPDRDRDDEEGTPQ